MSRRHQMLWRLHEHTREQIDQLKTAEPGAAGGDDWLNDDTALLATHLRDLPGVVTLLEDELARLQRLKVHFH